TSLAGGEGRVLDTLTGAFIIAVIQNGMNLTGVAGPDQRVILGLVILGAVLFDTAKRREGLGAAWVVRSPTSQRPHDLEPPMAPLPHKIYLDVSGQRRRYSVCVPSRYDGRTPLPVVLMFHGLGATARWTIGETGLDAKAEAAGFLAVLPEALPDEPGKPSTL